MEKDNKNSQEMLEGQALNENAKQQEKSVQNEKQEEEKGQKVQMQAAAKKKAAASIRPKSNRAALPARGRLGETATNTTMSAKAKVTAATIRGSLLRRGFTAACKAILHFLSRLAFAAPLGAARFYTVVARVHT